MDISQHGLAQIRKEMEKVLARKNQEAADRGQLPPPPPEPARDISCCSPRLRIKRRDKQKAIRTAASTLLRLNIRLIDEFARNFTNKRRKRRPAKKALNRSWITIAPTARSDTGRCHTPATIGHLKRSKL